MSKLPPVTLSIDAEGVAWIIFDDPSGRANVLNPDAFSVLRSVLVTLSGEDKKSKDAIKAVVITSAKERIFIAGADLKWLASLPDAKAAIAAAREAQDLFTRIAELKIPVVCAIHGACAGGGYELALACTWRIASNAPETRIGLPEIRLGLIPGWGGCTRLSRLIGAEPAVDFILKGSLVPAANALTAGLIDEVVPAGELKARAKEVALRLVGEGCGNRSKPASPSADSFGDWCLASVVRWPGQPAIPKVFEAVQKGAGLPMADALELEANLFGSVATGDVAKNLFRLHWLKEQARKITMDAWYDLPAEAGAAAPFRMIGIVGSGVMGSGIAHWCAAHGFGVILCDSNRAAIERGVAVIRELFADGVRRGKVSPGDAHRMTGGIGITTSLEDFEYCDLVIEAVVEDVAVKQKVFAELSAITKPDCVLVSNSSVHPIEKITAGVANPGRIIGFHFFNLVSRMPLIEVSPGAKTARVTADRALALVKALGKTAVICKSSPGGFVTRVMAFYLNEACRLWEEGSTIESIDHAMTNWGWPMGPMRLIDEIGVDSCDALFAGMEHYFPERFKRSGLCAQMQGENLNGRKNGMSAGFYDYAGGNESLNPLKIVRSTDVHQSRSEREIQNRLMAVMTDEAKRAVDEGVVKTADDADLALILGAGFPVVRGGLLRSMQS
ncbi:MAG TPA: 3-hydroxyacyl-CoA dehydrogenase NAD-binding domain-containing protein [Lacunisphaera sp.]|jgi:3-hydroxyacyl-CoA dehydrogenase/enoyl-CoA hydratase/3-hydroxybutyryl-CoA epimerase